MKKRFEDNWALYCLMFIMLVIASLIPIAFIAAHKQRMEAEQLCAELGFDGAVYVNHGGGVIVQEGTIYHCYRYDGEEYIQIPIIVLMNSK